MSNYIYALEIKDFSIAQQPQNVLRYDINCTTDDICNVFVTYKSTNTQEYHLQYSAISSNQTTHQLSIFGLLPNTSYQVNLSAFNESGITTISIDTITTQPLPDNIKPLEISHQDTSKEQKGFLHVSAIPDLTVQGAYQIICDKKGQVYWYTQTYSVAQDELPDSSEIEFNTRPCGGHFPNLFNKEILTLVGCQGLTRQKLTGEYEHFFINLDISQYLHHDLIINADDNFVALTAEQRTIPVNLGNGVEQTKLIGDGISIFSPQGETLWNWSTFEHLDLLVKDTTNIWRDIFDADATEWAWANSLKQDIDGHYIISFRALNQVAKVNAQTGAIIWILGENGTFDLADEDLFLQQHDCIVTPEGTYLLFDNGNYNAPISRAIEYRIDEANKTAAVVWKHQLPSEYFSIFTGSVDRTPNNNTLIGSGFVGEVFEVNPQNEVVWQANTGGYFYRVKYFGDLQEDIAEPSISNLKPTYCSIDTSIVLSATPFGGFFEGTGIENGTFNPSMAGVGTHTVSYTYGWKTVSQEITVQAPNIPTISQNNNTLNVENTNDNETYQWYFNDEMIENATESTHIAQQSGNYYVQVTNEEGCSTNSQSVMVIMTGEETITQPNLNIQLFPNPYQQTATLYYTLPRASQVQIEVLDIQGKKIKNLLPPTQQSAGDYQHFLGGFSGLHIIQLQTEYATTYIKAIRHF